MAGPLKQFEVHEIAPMQLGEIDISFTNASLLMVIAVTAISLFMLLGIRRHAMVPGRWQTAVELSYEFIAGIIRETIGAQGRRYFPLIFTLFMFILFSNMLGMIPYSFTVTSQIIVTFALSAIVFIGVTLLGFAKHGFRFFSFFICK